MGYCSFVSYIRLSPSSGSIEASRGIAPFKANQGFHFRFVWYALFLDVWCACVLRGVLLIALATTILFAIPFYIHYSDK